MKKYTWELATDDSSIHFKLKYLQISSITGSFRKFSGTVIAEERFNNPEVHLRIESDTLDTLDPKWNTTLTGESALSAQKYPYLTFDAVNGCHRSSGSIWELTGDLMIRNRIHSVTLVVNFSQVKAHKNGATAAFHLFGEISLEHFGLTCLQEFNIGDKIGLQAQVLLIRSAS